MDKSRVECGSQDTDFQLFDCATLGRSAELDALFG
jgi:hypothetical protein